MPSIPQAFNNYDCSTQKSTIPFAFQVTATSKTKDIYFWDSIDCRLAITRNSLVILHSVLFFIQSSKAFWLFALDPLATMIQYLIDIVIFATNHKYAAVYLCSVMF